MSQFTIYHNPRCSKSRQTLAILTDANKNLTVIEYLKNPPNAQTLELIIKRLDLSSPRELMRTKDDDYKALNLSDDSLTDKQLINAMITTPKLIERPIVLSESAACIGRPPENVIKLF